MISIDIHSNNFEANFIDWQAVITKSLTGEKISVKNAGVEVLQITPVAPKPVQKREFGLLRGKITIPDDKHWGDDEVQAMFDEALDKDKL